MTTYSSKKCFTVLIVVQQPAHISEFEWYPWAWANPNRGVASAHRQQAPGKRQDTCCPPTGQAPSNPFGADPEAQALPLARDKGQACVKGNKDISSKAQAWQKGCKWGVSDGGSSG